MQALLDVGGCSFQFTQCGAVVRVIFEKLGQFDCFSDVGRERIPRLDLAFQLLELP